MRHSAWILGLTPLFVFAAVGRAEASKLELGAMSGSIQNLSPFSEYADVVDGRPPVITVSTPLSTGGSFGWSQTSPLEIHVRLTDWEGNIGEGVAELTLTGEVTAGGKYDHAWASGKATVSDLKIWDPAKVPDWLPNLTAVVDVATVPGETGRQKYFMTLTITAPSVPEPGSVVVFLGTAGMGLIVQRRLRRRA